MIRIIKAIVENAFDVQTETLENFSSRKVFLNKLSAFILASFLILPFVLIDINLLFIYYDFEAFLVVMLVILFYIGVLLYTKFYLDVFSKGHDYKNKDNFRFVYVFNIFIAFILSLMVVLCYIIII